MLQYVEGDRLGQTTVHPRFQTALLLFRQGIGRYANHRQRQAKLTNALRQAITIHIRHVDVAEHDIDVLLAEDVERVDPVVRGHALVAERTQLIRQQAAVDRVIVDHEDHHVVVIAGLRLRGHQRRAIFRTGERNMENTPQQRQQFVGSRHAVQPFAGGPLLRNTDMTATEDDHGPSLPSAQRLIVSE